MDLIESKQKDDDKCYRRYIRYNCKEEENKIIKEKVLLYSSGESGTKIRNAVTGCYYPNYIVGTKDEYMLFKVRLMKGETPLLFFFDSPQQYEESQHANISDIKKQEWYERKVKMFDV